MFTETTLVSDSSARLHAPRVLNVVLPETDLNSRNSTGALNESAAAAVLDRGARAYLASAAGVVVRESMGLAAGSIMWRVIDDAHAISLEPLDTNGEPLGYSIIELRSAGSPILPNFVTATDDRGLALVLDFFTADGILYTISLDYKQFTNSEFDTSQPWCVMKQPIVFDLVNPQVLHSVSPKMLLLSLADGSLLKFSRTSALGMLESSQFSDQFAPSGLRWMFRNSEDRVEGKSHLSKRTIVAIDSSKDFAVTYSINNEIKLWSLAKASCVFRKPCQDERAALRLLPGPYVRFDNTGEYVAAYLPSDGRSGIEIFKVFSQGLESTSKPTHEPSETPANWLLTALIFYKNTSLFKITAAWRSNLSSIVKCLEVPHDRALASKSIVASRHEAKSLLSLPEESDLEHFVSSIFSTERYSDFALRRALQIYSGSPPAPYEPLEAYARESVQRTVQTMTDPNQKSLRLQWLRLDRICREIEAQSSELLGLAYVPSRDLTWVLRSGHVSLLTPANLAVTSAESFSKMFDSISKPALYAVESSLTSLITTPSDRLPFDAMEEIYRAFSQSSMNMPVLEYAGLEKALTETLQSTLTKPTITMSASPMTPLGAELLARAVADFSQEIRKFSVRAVAVIILAVSEGRLSNDVELFDAALSVFKSSSAILSLRAAVGSSPHHSYSSWASGLEIGISLAQVRVDGQTFCGLPQLLRQIVDVSSGSKGLELFYDLSLKNYAGLDQVAPYLPNTAAGVFVKGLGLLRTYPAKAKQLISRVVPTIALCEQPELEFLGTAVARASGFSLVYLSVSRLAEGAGALEASLHFAKLAAQSPVAESQKQLQRLALAAGDLDCAYQVICTLHRLGDSQISKGILQLLEAAAKQGKADHVLRVFPFIGMVEVLHEILLQRPTIGSVPSYKLLYVWCITREDYVGAATAIYKNLCATKAEPVRGDPSEAVAARFDWYTILLNALKCADEEDRWMVVNQRVITLKDVEQEYLSLLSEMTQALPKQAASTVFSLMRK
ncbi:hypothetical protein B9G98_04225 [Wickerhamiella sorbophila]|uniref:Nucleoporin Nup120/160 beta-propeller domain-containing protein n=1 Tax=Wickerhamiella sorbophila TaxID=45607 RepID=A0A2T0FNQ3_9ASCO|nr:hypothetical protein B9G98_04225 [Wickerhamiella sorbophila]PRT56605.1 hypothetical protein B9G98_04225 [Wickerhamiella sorbophila]